MGKMDYDPTEISMSDTLLWQDESMLALKPKDEESEIIFICHLGNSIIND
jgi:hypothetical protein